MNPSGEAVTILPQTTDRVLCICSDKPISEAGFNTIIHYLEKMIARYGKARILTYFKPYKGWEESAITKDMDFTIRYGKKFEKIAFVNPGEKFIFHIKAKGSLFGGEIRFYAEEELQDALDWVRD